MRTYSLLFSAFASCFFKIDILKLIMTSFVDMLAKHRVCCANIIVETPNKLFLGDFYAALDVKWHKANNIIAVLTVAQGLNIEPQVKHMVIDAIDAPEYDITKDLPAAFEFLDWQLKKGNVLVHCAAGISRSATVVIYYLMRTNKWHYQRAYDYVKSSREVICPNDGFVRRLKVEEKKLGLIHYKEYLQSDLKTIKQENTVPKRGVIRGRSVLLKQSRPLPSIKPIPKLKKFQI